RLELGMHACLHWRDLEATRVRDGYILRRAGTRGHARRLATRRGTRSRHSIATNHSESSRKQAVCVVRSGAKLTTSFAREVAASAGRCLWLQMSHSALLEAGTSLRRKGVTRRVGHADRSVFSTDRSPPVEACS